MEAQAEAVAAGSPRVAAECIAAIVIALSLVRAGGLLKPVAAHASHEEQVRFPPRILLSSGGEGLRARRGSFCTKVLCADGPALETKRALDVCAGDRVRVAIRARSKSLKIERSDGDERYVRARRVNLRRWSFRVGSEPPVGERLNLEFFVRYQRARTGFVDAFFYASIQSADSCPIA
jgi:hypothetical protein